MPVNFPGPYELRFSYSTTPAGLATFSHIMHLNVDLTSVPAAGTLFSAINAKTKGGVATPTLAAAVEAWLTLIANAWNTTTDFPVVELWKYAAGTFDATFISSYDPTVSAGLSASASLAAIQTIITFRSVEGGIMRLNFMESVTAVAGSQTFPTNITLYNNIAAFCVSSDAWMLARDTSYLVAPIRLLPGQNEQLFKKRFRTV
jgi:hypothetical protein